MQELAITNGNEWRRQDQAIQPVELNCQASELTETDAKRQRRVLRNITDVISGNQGDFLHPLGKDCWGR